MVILWIHYIHQIHSFLANTNNLDLVNILVTIFSKAGDTSLTQININQPLDVIVAAEMSLNIELP